MLQRDRGQKGSIYRIGGYWCVRYADWVIQENGERIRKQNLTYKLGPVLEEHARLKRPPEYVEKLQKATLPSAFCGTKESIMVGHENPIVQSTANASKEISIHLFSLPTVTENGPQFDRPGRFQWAGIFHWCL